MAEYFTKPSIREKKNHLLEERGTKTFSVLNNFFLNSKCLKARVYNGCVFSSITAASVHTIEMMLLSR